MVSFPLAFLQTFRRCFAMSTGLCWSSLCLSFCTRESCCLGSKCFERETRVTSPHIDPAHHLVSCPSISLSSWRKRSHSLVACCQESQTGTRVSGTLTSVITNPKRNEAARKQLSKSLLDVHCGRSKADMSLPRHNDLQRIPMTPDSDSAGLCRPFSLAQTLLRLLLQ